MANTNFLTLNATPFILFNFWILLKILDTVYSFARLLHEKIPNLPPISQETFSKIEKQLRELEDKKALANAISVIIQKMVIKMYSN